MLLDNKSVAKDKISTVYDFILKNLNESHSDGVFKCVTGYFTISMLANISEKFKNISDFNLILGNIIKRDSENDKIINILSQDEGLNNSFNLTAFARKAVEFLKQEKVNVKTVKPNFCHAKAYIYNTIENNSKDNFFVMGSSNLTESGLGLAKSSNVELNYANYGGGADFPELNDWFDSLWKSHEAKSIVEIEKKKIVYKNYLISIIEKLYKEYSPEDLYYKVLYEMFKADLIDFDINSNTAQQLVHLKNTKIFNLLFSFQQQGVLSLIQKIQRFNGAILADAVGLGKTWQALAVIKYFEIQGYKTFLFCPKKLSYNWIQYRKYHNSLLEEDKFDYIVRFHTDLQGDRISNYQDGLTLKNSFQKNHKVLIVIDESHNLRNDKSSRYEFLVENILKENSDVKVLLLSATPINTNLMDIRNQFKLLVRGDDRGFRDLFQITSLQYLFSESQAEFKRWQAQKEKTISEFIKVLPDRFFNLTDALVVARTRDMIKKISVNNSKLSDSLSFPAKEKPENIYISPKNIGTLLSFNDILKSIEIGFTAYKPSFYMEDVKVKSVTEDERNREKYLVQMMYILLIKRLESSWFAFFSTIKNILKYFITVRETIFLFENPQSGTGLFSQDNVIHDYPEDKQTQENEEENEEENDSELTIGKKNPVKISDIKDLDNFKLCLEKDISKLKELADELQKMQSEIDSETYPEFVFDSKDEKISALMKLIHKKITTSDNKKVLIFSVYKDTAKYIYEQLKKRGFKRIAYVSGDYSESDYGYKGKDFEPVLERFAPYTKLFLGKDHSRYYAQSNIPPIENFNNWKYFMSDTDTDFKFALKQPIDILIATDCLSEGQNLQDCDLLINYDIHWNPVRLIQRMGRIDRLKSPNKTVKGVNFWPADSYEDYLTLKKRVEERMALLSIIGAEIDDNLSPKMEEMVKDNPLISKQEEKMLEQLNISWEDIEDSSETFGFDKLSLESFRQELLDLFKEKKKELEAIPNGVFTGFKQNSEILNSSDDYSIVALIGYPKNLGDENHKYSELSLIFADGNRLPKYETNLQILNILKNHKKEKRYVPINIDSNDSDELTKIKNAVSKWFDWKNGKAAIDLVEDIFENGITDKNKQKSVKIEDIYKQENFDLVTWFIISNNKTED